MVYSIITWNHDDWTIYKQTEPLQDVAVLSYSSLSLRIEIVLLYEMIKTTSTMKAYIPMSRNAEI